MLIIGTWHDKAIDKTFKKVYCDCGYKKLPNFHNSNGITTCDGCLKQYTDEEWSQAVDEVRT